MAASSGERKQEGNNSLGSSGSLVDTNCRKQSESVLVPEMCYYCFDVLHSYLYHYKLKQEALPFTNDPYPLFVSWTIGSERKLRGCKGTFMPQNLHEGLTEYAITSATKDTRFGPISTEEFPKLHCSISILKHLEEAHDYMDWELGVHGIKIQFVNEKGRQRTATYLPEVPVEHGMDRMHAINSLLRKGGFQGPITPALRKSIQLSRFHSEKLTVSYSDYAAQKPRGHA